MAILVVFAILLTRGSEVPKEGVFSKTWLAGLAIAAAVFAVLGLGRVAGRAVAYRMRQQRRRHSERDWQALMGRYVLPLEIVAVLLTAALLGAVIVAMHEKERAK